MLNLLGVIEILFGIVLVSLGLVLIANQVSVHQIAIYGAGS